MSYFPRHIYLRRPPPERPPPPPPRNPPPPILDEPRELLARAWFPLMPAEAPPNALRFVALGVRDTSRLPTRSAPPPRFISLVPALGPAPRFDISRPPPPAGCCRGCAPAFCRAFASRLAMESPRVVPPNLSPMARSYEWAPPRCYRFA